MTDILEPTSKGPVPQPRQRAADPKAGSTWRMAILGALIVLAGLTGGWPLLVMIAALVVMIFLHELGHFLTAKWAGMKVTEFFIGFGPRIWSFRRGETEYGLKVIPAGAYVKIIGMHNLDEFDEADADRTYMSKPFWRRLSVAVAGSTMHFLLALVCFFVAFAVVGIPGGRLLMDDADIDALEARVGWDVGVVTENSAAAEAGIEVGDHIVSVDGIAVENFAEFGATVVERPDQTVPVVFERDGRTSTVDVTIGRRDDGTGFFGIASDFDAREALDQLPTERSGVVGAVGDSLGAYGESISQTFAGLGHILSPSGLSDLGRAAFAPEEEEEARGPVVSSDGTVRGGTSSGGAEVRAAGLIGISDAGAGLLDAGYFGYFLALFATINIFIGIFNLLPLLPLDGGHVVIAVYEKIRSMLQGGREYHIDVVKLLPVTYAVVLVLAFLGVSTIVLDTRSLVGG